MMMRRPIGRCAWWSRFCFRSELGMKLARCSTALSLAWQPAQGEPGLRRALLTHSSTPARRRAHRVERYSGPPPRENSALMIRGQFLSIDEGNRTERMVIGLGLGRTKVEADVQAVDLTPGSEQTVETLQATGESGAKPGAAEAMGVGAL